MIKYDSGICDNIINNIKNAGDSLKSDFSGKVLTDYSDFISLSLFSEKLQNIDKAVTSLVESYESFVAVLSESKNSWGQVEEDVQTAVDNFDNNVNANNNQNPTYTGPTYSGPTYSGPTYSGPTGPTTTSDPPTATTDVPTGKAVSINEVKELLAKIDSTVMPILLQKINKLSNGTSIVDLLLDKDNAVLLTSILKKILGDTAGEDINEIDAETIQKILLSKLKLDNIDITTEEGKAEAKKIILQEMNKEADEAAWNKLLYGDNTVKYSGLSQTWIVAKTVQDLASYASYVQSAGVRQNANTAEWGDSCLAFAGAHAYDLYAGTQTSGQSAANYAHGGAFEDFINDDKQVVLSKIYDEIMQGRPVVLQVNGNLAGTSRHFVTVVGFKEGVVSGSTLKETDLLIIDSWDGKVESMDGEKSRFMTTGAACHKDYSGYRLRVLKS